MSLRTLIPFRALATKLLNLDLAPDPSGPKTRGKGGLFAAGALFALAAVLAAPVLATTTINEQYTAATIDPGDTSQFKITVVNASTVALTAAKVTVLLLPQVSIAATPAISNTCGFTVVQAASGASTIELTGGTIPANNGSVDGQCLFQVDVTATAPGNWVSTIPASTTPDATTSGYTAQENAVAVWNTTAANATLSINTLLNPTGSKSYASSPVKVGDPTTLTITLSNPNAASTVPLTTFTDILPADMVLAATPSASTSCSGTGSANGAVTAVAGSNSITLNGGTIGNSGTCTISVKVEVPTITGTTQSFNNTLGAGAIGNTRGLTSTTFSQNLTVNTPIAVSKSFVTPSISAGQASLMTITISNNSTVNALNIISFDDNLSGSSIKILNTASSPVAAIADPAVLCTGVGAVNGTLSAPVDALDQTLNLAGATAGPGGQCSISAYVTSSVDGAHTNNILADAVNNPSGYHSAASSAILTANGQLTLNKTVNLSNVAPGQWTTFTVTINNWSGGQIDNVTFSDLLPSNGVNQMLLHGTNPVSQVGCTVGTWTGADGETTLRWTGGTVAAGIGASPGTCVIVFKARLPFSATTGLRFSNQIPINGVTGTCRGINCSVGDNNAVNNPATSPAVDVTTVDSGALGKAFAPSSIAQGGTSTLTVTVYNRTLAALTGVNLTDTLPTGLTLAANPAASNSCGGTLQAFPGDNRLILTGGTVAARPDASQNSSCSFSAKVTGTAVGSYTNDLPLNALHSNEVTTSAAVSANLTISTGLLAAKTFTPTSLTSGGTARVKITVTNSSSGQLTNVAVDDNTFSAGLSVANPDNAATNCAGSPTLVVNPGQTNAQLQGATLAAGASCDFSFDVLTSGTGPWSNTIPIGNISSAEGPSNVAAVTQSLSAIAASIGINKGFSPTVVSGGVPSTLQIDITNPSAIVITGAGFTDTFPPGIEVYSVPNASTDCAGGTVTAVPGDGKISLFGATLAANGTCHVYVQTTSVRFLNLTNIIPVGAISSHQGYTNALATTASLSTLQGLGVMKQFSPAYMVPNAISKLKLRLVSTFDPNAVTPITLTGVSFTDSLPSGMTVAATPNASTDCTSGTLTASAGSSLITLSGASIVPGTNCTLSVDVTASVLGAYTNTIPANAITTTQGIPNQSPASDILHVVAKPTLSKAFSPASVNMGVSSTLTVTINNNYVGAVDLTGVSLTDALPSGLFIASTPGASAIPACGSAVVSAAPGTGTLTLSGASIAAGATCTFQAKVVSSTPASYTNNIATGALISAQGLTNPGPTSDILIVLPPASVTKRFSPASIASGGTSTLTITLGNGSAAPITLTSALVDALPGNVFVHATPAIGGTCTPGSVTAAAGATSIAYASGAAIPAGGCTILVDVTSSTIGVYTNTIAAGQLSTSAGVNQDPTYASLAVGGAFLPPTVGKAFSPATIAINEIATLTLTLGNLNATALTLAVGSPMVDTLPVGVVVATPNGLGGTCTLSSVTATAGAGTVTYAAGATIPATVGCTIVVNVTSATADSYTNTINAGGLVTDGGSNALPAVDGLVVTSPIPPAVSKLFSPNTINPGGTSTLSIDLENDNAANITLSALFTDMLPTGVTVAASPNIGGTCKTGNAGAGWGVISTGASSVTYASGATIPPGGCSIQVDVTAASNASSPYTNSIAANALSTSAGFNGADASAKLFVNPFQPPSVSKTFSSALLPKKATSTLTLSLGNGNAAAISLTADFIDTLPGTVVVATPNGLVTSAGCDAAKVVAVAGSNTVTYQSGATLAGNGGCTIQVNVTSLTATALLTNTINAGTLQTGAGNNAVGATAPIQFVDWPVAANLSLTKGFDSGTGVAGDTKTVTLTWRNANAVSPTQNFYQCVISDPLPTAAFDLTANNPVSTLTPIGYTFGFDTATNTVTYTRTDTTTPCETTTQTATFTVNLKAGVVTGSTYSNTATLTAKTLPSNAPVSVDPLTKTASANVVVGAPATPTKTVFSTSQAFTDSGDSNKNANPLVAIGETVTYSILFNLPPGVTNAVTLADEITSGIGDVALLSATLARSSTSLSAANDLASINAAAVNVPVDVTASSAIVSNEFRFSLGNVSNTGAAAIYTLTVTLRMGNVATNVAGHTITDQGRFRYQNASAVDVSVTTAAKDVHIALPIVAMSKNVSPAAPAGGDTVTYTLTVSNTSSGANSADGYDWTFSDVLPTELVSPGGFTVTTNTHARTISGSFAGNTLNGSIDRLIPGESVVVQYSATVAAGTAYGKTIINSATARATTIPASQADEVGERSGAGGVNNLSATTSASVTTSQPTMTKTVLNAQTYYAIGDVVHYRITVAVPTGSTTNFNITDTLPTGLSRM